VRRTRQSNVSPAIDIIMGFNFTGLYVNKNYKTSESIQNDLQYLNLTLTNQVALEESLTYYDTHNDTIDVISINEGTLILFSNHSKALRMIPNIKKATSTGGKGLRFSVSETSMTFLVEYYENGQFKWEEIISESESVGDNILYQHNVQDPLTFFLQMFKEVSGKNFFQLDPSLPAKRYKIGIPKNLEGFINSKNFDFSKNLCKVLKIEEYFRDIWPSFPYHYYSECFITDKSNTTYFIYKDNSEVKYLIVNIDNITEEIFSFPASSGSSNKVEDYKKFLTIGKRIGSKNQSCVILKAVEPIGSGRYIIEKLDGSNNKTTSKAWWKFWN
jgi:hypothetical protein